MGIELFVLTSLVCCNNSHRLCGLTNKHLFLNSRGGEIDTTVQEWLISGDSPLPGLKMSAIMLYLHRKLREISSSFQRTLILSWNVTFKASFKLMAVPTNTIHAVQVVRASTYDFGRDTNIQFIPLLTGDLLYSRNIN